MADLNAEISSTAKKTHFTVPARRKVAEARSAEHLAE
jgi:hypothetical protein